MRICCQSQTLSGYICLSELGWHWRHSTSQMQYEILWMWLPLIFVSTPDVEQLLTAYYLLTRRVALPLYSKGWLQKIRPGNVGRMQIWRWQQTARGSNQILSCVGLLTFPIIHFHCVFRLCRKCYICLTFYVKVNAEVVGGMISDLGLLGLILKRNVRRP